MIDVAIQSADGTSLGIWKFSTLPRLQEDIILAGDRYRVINVEHWPDAPESKPHDETWCMARIYVIESKARV